MSDSNPTNQPYEPVPPAAPDGVAFHEQIRVTGRHSTTARIGIVAGSAVLVAIGILAAMGASPAPSPASDPTTSGTGANPSAPAASASPGTKGQGRVRPDWGGPIGSIGAIGGFGRSDIAITAIDGSSITLKTDDGWTRTITVTGSTTITKGGATITVGDLAVGDHLRFRQEKATDGTYTVTAIGVVLPTVVGQVSAIIGQTLTVTQPGGTTVTIHVDANTTYRVDGATGALSDLKVGSFIVAEGTQRADGSLDAADIRAGDLKHGGFGGPGVPGGRDGQKGLNASPAPSSGAS